MNPVNTFTLYTAAGRVFIVTITASIRLNLSPELTPVTRVTTYTFPKGEDLLRGEEMEQIDYREIRGHHVLGAVAAVIADLR